MRNNVSVGKMHGKIGLRMEELSSGCAEQKGWSFFMIHYTSIDIILKGKEAVVDKTPTQHITEE